MSLYGWIILCTIAGPLFLSFDRKVHFYTYLRYLLPSILVVGTLFLIWDEYFTQNSVWGFNPNYITRHYIGHLPWEEVSFFLVVPYACLFIHEVLKAYFPSVKLRAIAHYFAFAFTLSGLIFGLSNMGNWYTSTACLVSAMLTIGIYFVGRKSWYPNFVFTYLVVLIPFLIVNGILTGAVTTEPIVWYSEDHIMGPRILTIPVEDLYYNYSMLLPVTAIFEYLKKRSQEK